MHPCCRPALHPGAPCLNTHPAIPSGVQVAEDECRHFLLLEKRLEEMGSFYGALPAHDGLWESAMETGGLWESAAGPAGSGSRCTQPQVYLRSMDHPAPCQEPSLKAGTAFMNLRCSSSPSGLPCTRAIHPYP